jgi:hypothetical protein
METLNNQSDKFLQSSYYEKLIEHIFIADLLETAWLKGQIQIEVSKAEIDNSGYDLILECNKVIRHIQLKCSDEKSKTNVQKINKKLSDKPSGCIVWIVRKVDEEHSSYKLRYLFFGGEPGQPLHSLDNYNTAKHSKGNAEGTKVLRPNIKQINKGVFIKVDHTKDLLNKLFGLIL